MSNVSTQVLQSMLNHLTASYTEEEAREILKQKYPDAETVLASIRPENYRVTSVEMGSTIKVTEPSTVSLTETTDDAPATGNTAKLKSAVKAKVAKQPKAAKAPKATKVSKVDQARELFAKATDQSRGAMIAIFMDKLGMSKAAASTYYYNIKK